MSMGYYLVCRRHRVAVFVTDNKGNPLDRAIWRRFHDEHVVDQECYQQLAFQTEDDMEFGNDVVEPADDD